MGASKVAKRAQAVTSSSRFLELVREEAQVEWKKKSSLHVTVTLRRDVYAAVALAADQHGVTRQSIIRLALEAVGVINGTLTEEQIDAALAKDGRARKKAR